MKIVNAIRLMIAPAMVLLIAACTINQEINHTSSTEFSVEEVVGDLEIEILTENNQISDGRDIFIVPEKETDENTAKEQKEGSFLCYLDIKN